MRQREARHVRAVYLILVTVLISTRRQRGEKVRQLRPAAARPVNFLLMPRYFAGSTVNRSGSAITALKRANGSWIVLLIWPSFGRNEFGTEYLNPSPRLRGRITTMAKIVLADADADRQERAEAAVNAGEQVDPFLRRLGAGSAGASQQQQDGDSYCRCHGSPRPRRCQ